MRTRMLGGVGGVRRNPAPIPIGLLFGRSDPSTRQIVEQFCL